MRCIVSHSFPSHPFLTWPHHTHTHNRARAPSRKVKTVDLDAWAAGPSDDYVELGQPPRGASRPPPRVKTVDLNALAAEIPLERVPPPRAMYH